MRTFRCFIIALIVIPSLASEAIAPSVAGDDMSGGWRRTREGWQHAELVCAEIQYRRPALHPTVVGSLELLLTMTAMLALTGDGVVQPAAEPQVKRSRLFSQARAMRAS